MNQLPLLDYPSNKTPREKNLVAIIILAGGLLIGSLVVDVAQLFTGSGFSTVAIRDHNLLETDGKTWVAYTDPKVTLRVVSDEACPECNQEEALVWLRRIVPTVEAVRIEAQSVEGQELISRFSLRTLPSFIFDSSVEKTDFFTEAAPLFLEKEGSYLFDMNKIGLPVGKYLVAPAVEEDDILIGNKEAPNDFIVFSDFQCQYCKLYHAEYKKVLEEYGDRFRFIFKHLPLPSNPQSENAATAAECADEQGKFMDYADLLFEKQSEWGRTTGTQPFKNLAWRIQGMNGRDFAACMDSGKYNEKIVRDIQVAQDFNLVSTPTTFIGTELIEGAATLPDLKPILDKVLGQTSE